MGMVVHKPRAWWCIENNGSVFKQGFDKYGITTLFHPSHPDIVGNKQRRFNEYMNWAHNGRLFHRTTHKPSFGKTAFYYNKPIFNRLQSSFEDVEFELDHFRHHIAHCASKVVFAGGDGLSVMRMEWSIARNRDKYLGTNPIVIPRLGDHPHGTTHINHACWRLWFPFMEKQLQAMDYAYIKNDFTVKESKHFEFALYILMRANAEFVDEVSHGFSQVPYDQTAQFLALVEQNIDAAYCVHFLYDYAFLFHQMRRSIRVNDANKIDLCWREAFTTFHTKEANKTQYSPMAIMHIYRTEALVDPLRILHDNMRCLALSSHADSMVGWDMPIEKQNYHIRQDVIPPNEENIERYVAELNFTAKVSEGLRDIWKHNRSEYKPGEMKQIDADVAKVKLYLYTTIIYDGEPFGPLGRPHWFKFTEPVPRSKILNKPANHATPWRKMHEAMFPTRQGAERYQDFIRRHLDTHVTWA